MTDYDPQVRVIGSYLGWSDTTIGLMMAIVTEVAEDGLTWSQIQDKFGNETVRLVREFCTTRDQMDDQQRRWAEEDAIWERYKNEVNEMHSRWTSIKSPEGCGYVYAIEMWPTGDPFAHAPDEMVKIGRSIDPVKRMKEISRTSVKMPYELKLRHSWWAEDAIATERLLHTMFARFRVDGEWFKIPHEFTNVFHDIWYFHGSPGPPEGIVANDNYGHWSADVFDFFQHHMDENERIYQEREARKAS